MSSHIKYVSDDSFEQDVLKAEGIVHTRFSVKFYVTAMLFILFDIETVFLLPWAVVLRELGVLPLAPVSLVGMLPDPQQRI